jgi:hypothetical protein
MKQALILITIACMLQACTRNKVQPFNTTAAITGTGVLPFDLLDANLITSGINASTQRMHTLYGNEIALQHARTATYPGGAVLVEVTWKQQADPVWFGGNIPGSPESVEVVQFINDGNNKTEAHYHYYAGNPLKEQTANIPSAAARIAAITGERIAVMP